MTRLRSGYDTETQQTHQPGEWKRRLLWFGTLVKDFVWLNLFILNQPYSLRVYLLLLTRFVLYILEMTCFYALTATILANGEEVVDPSFLVDLVNLILCQPSDTHKHGRVKRELTDITEWISLSRDFNLNLTDWKSTDLNDLIQSLEEESLSMFRDQLVTETQPNSEEASITETTTALTSTTWTRLTSTTLPTISSLGETWRNQTEQLETNNSIGWTSSVSSQDNSSLEQSWYNNSRTESDFIDINGWRTSVCLMAQNMDNLETESFCIPNLMEPLTYLLFLFVIWFLVGWFVGSFYQHKKDTKKWVERTSSLPRLQPPSPACRGPLEDQSSTTPCDRTTTLHLSTIER